MVLHRHGIGAVFLRGELVTMVSSCHILQYHLPLQRSQLAPPREHARRHALEPFGNLDVDVDAHVVGHDAYLWLRTLDGVADRATLEAVWGAQGAGRRLQPTAQGC